MADTQVNQCRYYCIEKSQDILIFTRFMNIYNLCGNTLGLLLLRFEGNRIAITFIFDEIMLVILMVLLLPLLIYSGIII